MNMYGTSGLPLSNAGYFNLGKSDKLFHVYRRKYFLIFLFFGLGSVSLTRGKKSSLHVQRESVRFPPPFLAFLGRKMVAGMWEYERRPLSSLSTLFFPKCAPPPPPPGKDPQFIIGSPPHPLSSLLGIEGWMRRERDGRGKKKDAGSVLPDQWFSQAERYKA